MKLFLLLVLFTLSLLSDTSIFDRQAKQKPKGVDDAALCKLFTQKAIKYKATMRDDEYAHATLASYEKRAKIYCSKK